MSLKGVPLGSPELFNVLIEIPAGGQNKFEYDKNLDALKLDFVFHGDVHFPFNYGLIPQTKGGDGDHLDVFVLSSKPIPSGTLVQARPIGMMEMHDRDEEDNKIIAVSAADPIYKERESIESFSQEDRNKLLHFFKGVALQKNKKIVINGFVDKEAAIAEIKKCHTV